MKGFAFFDFDGTLSKGFISMEFLDYIFKKQLYLKEIYDSQMGIFEQHKKNILSSDEWCQKWGEL